MMDLRDGPFPKAYALIIKNVSEDRMRPMMRRKRKVPGLSQVEPRLFEYWWADGHKRFKRFENVLERFSSPSQLFARTPAFYP